MKRLLYRFNLSKSGEEKRNLLCGSSKKSGKKFSISKVQKLHSEKAILFRPLVSSRLQKVALNGGTFFRVLSRLFNPIEISHRCGL
jgi:hypothetical protein